MTVYRVKDDCDPWLNVRTGRGVNYPAVGRFTPGQKIDVIQIADGWAAVRMYPDTVTLHVSVQFIEPVSVAIANSAIGVHIAFNGHQGDIVGVNQRLAAAGVHPLYVVVSDPGLANKLKDDNPLATVVYRWVEGPGDRSPFGQDENSPDWWNGAAWFDELWRRHSQAPLADFHQMYNEVSFAQNVQSEAYARKVNQFELELMRRANERGVKVTIGNYMPGVPEKRHIDQLRPAFAFAEQHRHALCYHGYSSKNNDATFSVDSDYFFLRWVPWVKDFPKLRVILGEVSHYNVPRFRGPDDLLARFKEADTLLAPLREAGRQVDVAYWSIRTQNDPNYTRDDFTPHLGVFEQYRMSKR